MRIRHNSHTHTHKRNCALKPGKCWALTEERDCSFRGVEVMPWQGTRFAWR